ncbi:MAG TPA: DUF2807 domain-containing protein [Phenylobacterium sp.]|nr:DUF2807 domain-containing protein [Phenylobacterium sp.]
MTHSILGLGLAAAGLALAGAAQAATVEVKDAVARVIVVPEERSDVRVDIVATHPNLPLQVRSRDGRVIVDGDLSRRVRNCRGSGRRASVTVSGVGEVAYADMPQVVIRTPRAVDVSVSGAVHGAVGRSQSVRLANTGCGDWKIANTDGELRLALAGSGDMAAGSAGAADLRVAGSGDISTQRLTGPVRVDIAGSGDVSVAEIRSPSLQARIAGSGQVDVDAGAVDALDATIAGSGDVRFDGVAGQVKASIAGSGDVRVREVTGPVQKSALGSGTVIVQKAP